jgi:SAM-dependent methyltransferase
MTASQVVTADWYESPRYYDIVFEAGSTREARFLESAQRRYGLSRGRRALEPACGSGRLVLALARRGWNVTGLDLSEPMLAYARERIERARLRATIAGAKFRARVARADMAAFRFAGPFDLAHCLVSTFKYLLDESGARSHLECVARALAPGGIYALGFHLSEYGARSRCRERWVERRGRTTVICNTQVWPADRRSRLENVRTRLLVRERGRELRTETSWRFRAYDEHQVIRLFRSVPELEHVATYDFGYDIDRPRDWPDEQLDCVFILRRRA